MASVNELLLAAQAKYQRPKSKIGELNDIISMGFDNYNNAKDRRVDLTRKLIEKQILEQQQRESAENKAVKDALLGVQPKATPAERAARLMQVYDDPSIKLSSDGKSDVMLKRREPGGSGLLFNPNQIEAINSRDPKKMAAAFPNGIPKEALGYSYGAERIANLEAERAREQDERDFKRRERRSNERTNLVNKFNSDAAVKKAQQSIDAANTIRELANSGNPIAAGSVPTFMARASGEVGNLSEADKAPFGGSRAIMDRVAAATQQAAIGQLTEDNRRFINELANIMEQKAKENVKGLARTRSKQFGRASDFLNEDDIYRTLWTDDETLDESPAQRKARLLKELQGEK